MKLFDWNYRIMPFFREDFIDNSKIPSNAISINDNLCGNYYSNIEKEMMISYFEHSKSILSTTCFRKNYFSNKNEASITTFTDGEVLFDNLFLDYIKQDKFVIPKKWFDIIKAKNFIMPEFKDDVNIEVLGFENTTFDAPSPYHILLK